VISFSFELPTHRVEDPKAFVSADGIMELAAAAEAAGFRACHVTDHPAPDGKWLDMGGHHALDPFVALSFAAAATESMRLLTNVFIAAYRNPFLSAKSIQSLDVLSGGRFILGTAAGYLKPEFAALGVDFAERNDLLDEALDVMQEVWTGADTAYEGRHFNARGVRHVPTPVTRPRPPIWIGGNSTRAIRRAVTSFEGWSPFATAGYGRASRTADIGGIDDLTVRIAKAHEIAEEIGRVDPLEICYSAGGLGDSTTNIEERRELIGRCAEAGVTWLPISVSGADRGEVAENLAAFADSFIA
jgi:probable F420-dependent oxidoreductase